MFAPFSLSIPACLIDDVGPIESMKRSYQLFRKEYKTILGMLGAFIAIFLALNFVPIIGLILTASNFGIILVGGLGIIAMIAFFISLFVVFPAMCIAFTKLYYDYHIPQAEEVSEEESPIRLF